MKNFIVRVMGLIVGVALFVGAFLFSVVFFAVAFVIAVLFVGFFFWKTRHLRKQMRQRFDQRDVIEGELIRTPEQVVSRKE